MFNFTIEEIIDSTAVELYNKREAIKHHRYNAYDALSDILNNKGIDIKRCIASELFGDKCCINAWNVIERPYSDDCILFCNDIVSLNGKVAMTCKKDIGDKNHFQKTLVLTAAKYFLTTQSHEMFFSQNNNEKINSIKIADNIKYFLTVGEFMLEMELTSPEVLWAYINHKLESSKKIDSAEEFDKNHPQELNYDMLKCSFNIDNETYAEQEPISSPTPY